VARQEPRPPFFSGSAGASSSLFQVKKRQSTSVTQTAPITPASTEERARQSLGSSSQPIYEMVRRLVAARIDREHPIKLLDVGCGTGNLHDFVDKLVDQYEGVDVLQYETYPSHLPFHKIDLDSGRADLPDAYADFVVAVETIEHLENPRAFMRELVRLCRPGGWVIVTTPNQLSLLSKLTLLVKNQFNAFTETNYPAHITALLEIDLRRMAAECKLVETQIGYSHSGRIPGVSIGWPKLLSRFLAKSFSDNLSITGRKGQSGVV